MISFTELRNSSNDSFQKLTDKLTKMSQGSFQNQDDDTFWQPTVDKNGNGYAVLRFLPAPGNEEEDFVRIWRHAFQGPSGWYIENSLSTIGKPDPVMEMNSKLWNSGPEGKLFVSGNNNVTPAKPGSKRKVEFVAGVYIVEDTGKPENNGKVKRYRFGVKIYDKLKAAATPEFPDIAPFNPFDMWKGANFKLKARKVEGRRNYDSSEWDLIDGNDNMKVPRGPLFKDDEKLEAIWRSAHSLQELIAPDKFKSYNELKARLQLIMGQNEVVETETADVRPAPVGRTRPATTPPWEDQMETTSPIASTDTEDSLSFFKELADEE